MLTSEHTKKHEEDGFVGGLTNEEESGLWINRNTCFY